MWFREFSPPSARRCPVWGQIGAAVLLGLIQLPHADAQSVLASAQQLGISPTDVPSEFIDAALSSGINPAALTSGLGLPPGVSAAGSAFQLPGQLYLDAPLVYGPLSVRPNLSYSTLYNDGLPTSPGMRADSWIDTVSAGFLATWGERLILDYTLAQAWYSGDEFEDTLDHDLNFSGAFTIGESPISVVQSYRTDSSPQLESFGQTNEEIAVTSISTSYPLTNRWSLEGSGSQSLRFIEADEDQYSWNGNLRARASLTDRSTVAIGVSGGYVAIAKNADTIFWGPQSQFTWQPGDKLSLTSSVGYQERYTYDSRTPKTVDGTFDLGMEWQPWIYTVITAKGRQDLQPSLFNGQTQFSRGWNAGIQQRLLGRVFLNAAFAREDVEYRPGPQSPDPTLRTDVVEVLTIGASVTVLKRLLISITLQRTDNQSSLADFDYDAISLGATFSYSF